MTRTQRLLAAALAVAALAGPAFAQYGPPPAPGYGPPPPGMRNDHIIADEHGGWDLDRRLGWIQDRISRGRADGSLDRHEFRRVQGQLNSIRHDEQRMRWRNGGRLDGDDMVRLQQRLDQLNDEIRWLRNNDEHRPW